MLYIIMRMLPFALLLDNILSLAPYQVSAVGLNEVLSQGAYMLLYSR